MNERHDDLQEIIDAALREMAAEEGDGFDPQACNLAEFCRRTGLTWIVNTYLDDSGRDSPASLNSTGDM